MLIEDNLEPEKKKQCCTLSRVIMLYDLMNSVAEYGRDEPNVSLI